MSSRRELNLSRSTAQPRKLITPQHSPIKLVSRKGKDRERRWTTGLERGQLKLPTIEKLVTNDDSSPIFSHNDPSTLSLSSWSSTLSDIDNGESSFPIHSMRTPTPTSGNYSQPEELIHMKQQFFGEDLMNHQYQLSYEIAVDSSPLSPSNYTPNAQEAIYRSHIVQEMITTEERYIKDLTDIVEGYYYPLKAKIGILSITSQDVTDLFCNIIEILAIHRNLLEDLQKGDGDYENIGETFITKAEDFKSYTEYCNNYPKSIETFSKLVSDNGIPWFMKSCQQKLQHLLPLGAYLLKPVQRVLKYFLLLEDLLRHMHRSTKGYGEVLMAKNVMTQVADHINEMKRKYDDTVRVQELQSLLNGWEGKDLIKYGELVLEDTLRVAYSKSGNTKLPSSALKSTKEMDVFLFRKMLLITKRKDEGYQYKHHTEMKDMQLTEQFKENNLWFQIRQISSKATLTFQARTVEIRTEWSEQIKELLMDSIPHLPDKAKLLILQGFPTDLRNSAGGVPMTTIQSKTLPRDLQNSSPIRQFLIHSKGNNSPRQQRNKPKVKKAPVQPTKSLIEAGYNTGSSTYKNNFSLSFDASKIKSEETKKNRKLRFGSLPNAVEGPSWTRSDSNPDLTEEGHSRPSSRVSNNDDSNEKVSHEKSSSSVISDSRSSSGSPVNNRTQLAVIGTVRNSKSSPDLKASALDDDEHKNIFIEEENELQFNKESSQYVDEKEQPALVTINTNEYKIESDSTGDYSRPLTPLSPANCSEISFNMSEDYESYAVPMHMRSKSAPLDIQERQILETIPSTENTPRGSIIKNETSPSFSFNTEHEDEYGSSPLMIIQSLRNAKEDDIIEIKPSLELSGNHMDSFISTHANGGNAATTPSNIVPTHSSSQDNMEMMFEELMSSSLNHRVSPSLQSQEVPVLEFVKHFNLVEDHLGQPIELSEGSPISPISPISIPEIKVDLAINDDVDQDVTTNTIINELETIICHPICGSSGDSSYLMGSHTPSTPIRYSRPTTPYTSIEDIPSEVNKQNCSDLDDLIIANRGLFGDIEFDSQQSQNDQLSPTDDHLSLTNDHISSTDVRVKRTQSFGGQRVEVKKKNNIRKSSHPNSKGNEKIDWPGFLKRNHNFKEQATARPISIIGLVHSTRDNSDLLELHDALRRSKRIKPEIIRKDEENELDSIMKGVSSSRGNENVQVSKKMSDVSDSHHSRSDSVPVAHTREESDVSIDDMQSSNEKRASVNSTGSGKSRESGRRNRWSIGRPLHRNKKKKSKQESTSDEESKCSSISELSFNEVPLSPTIFIDNPDDNEDELFLRDEASDFNNTSDVNEALRLSRVQALARDYSMRIKDKHSASCSPVQEETGSNSPQPSETKSISSSSPGWLRDLKDKKRRAGTVSETMRSRESSMTYSLSQPTSPVPPSPHNLRSNSGTPTTVGAPSPSSADTKNTFNFGDDKDLVTDLLQPSEMQRYTSENVLTKSIDSVLDLPVPQATSKRKKPGWVRYLVKKFNTPK